MALEFDVPDAPHLQEAAVIVVAASLFLNAGRFPDLRSTEEIEWGTPVSYENCIPGSLFLSAALEMGAPSIKWIAHFGRCDYSWHAFVLDEGGVWLADITGDQFGLPAGLMKPLDEVKQYEVQGRLSSVIAVDSGDHARLRRWLAQWAVHGPRYIQEARGVLGAEIPGLQGGCAPASPLGNHRGL